MLKILFVLLYLLYLNHGTFSLHEALHFLTYCIFLLLVNENLLIFMLLRYVSLLVILTYIQYAQYFAKIIQNPSIVDPNIFQLKSYPQEIRSLVSFYLNHKQKAHFDTSQNMLIQMYVKALILLSPFFRKNLFYKQLIFFNSYI